MLSVQPLAGVWMACLGTDEPGHRGRGLPDLVLGGGAALGDRLGNAMAKMLIQQPKGDRLQGLGHRRDLGEHVDAVLVLLVMCCRPPTWS